MTYTYKTKGTCSRKITFDLEDGIVKNVNFVFCLKFILLPIRFV